MPVLPSMSLIFPPRELSFLTSSALSLESAVASAAKAAAPTLDLSMMSFLTPGLSLASFSKAAFTIL